MRSLLIVALALCLGAVLAQRPRPHGPENLYPKTADGFDTVWLDDVDFVTEMSFQTGGSDQNLSYYVYGNGALRTVFPGNDDEWFVGKTPNEFWHLPFLDFHTFENGSDIWGFGPVSSIHFPLTPNPVANPPWWSVNSTYTFPQGYQYQIVVVTTKQFPNNPHGIFWLEQPLGFQGTYFAVHVITHDPTNVLGYFAGFFPNTNGVIQFGLVRAHFNVSLFASGNATGAPGWTFNPDSDVAVIYNQTQLVNYNNEFKPLLVHMNASNDQGYSYIAVVDPYWDLITMVRSNFQNPSEPLNVDPSYNYRPMENGNIVSAVAFGDTLIVGVAVNGMGAGWIEFLNTPSLGFQTLVKLPGNFSNPKALVVDIFAPVPTLYVGVNGGSAVLRIDISKRNANNSYTITGYQMVPHYLHEVWNGQPAPKHIYFSTNEQHSKIFRVSKDDFCPLGCMQNGYCKNGKCVCSPDYQMRSGQCQLRVLLTTQRIVSKDHGGEVALGVFFALSFVAACAGWFLVWRNRRAQYYAV